MSDLTDYTPEEYIKYKIACGMKTKRGILKSCFNRPYSFEKEVREMFEELEEKGVLAVIDGRLKWV